MSDLITIPRSDWYQVKRAIKSMNELLDYNSQVRDLVNRKEAIEITGLSSKSFTNYVCRGKITVETINEAGQPFFSRKKLMGLK